MIRDARYGIRDSRCAIRDLGSAKQDALIYACVFKMQPPIRLGDSLRAGSGAVDSQEHRA